MDARQFQLRCPDNSGSLYYNHKKTFSVSLMAVCDGKCNFLAVDIGAYGSEHDSTVFSNWDFGQALENDLLGVPEDSVLPNTYQKFPYYLVGDEAFALSQKMMRPIPRKNLGEEEKTYNYRISRARRTIENAFGN